MKILRYFHELRNKFLLCISFQIELNNLNDFKVFKVEYTPFDLQRNCDRVHENNLRCF